MINSTDKNSSLLIKTAQLFLIIAFILCLGNIIGFIAMNVALGKAPSFTSIYWQRLFVTKITYMFIVPGLWIMLTSQIILNWKLYGFFKQRWFTFVQVLSILVFINGIFIILPLSNKVTAVAIQQMQKQILIPEYTTLKGMEDMFGMFNFFMLLLSLIFIVYKPFDKKQELTLQNISV